MGTFLQGKDIHFVVVIDLDRRTQCASGWGAGAATHANPTSTSAAQLRARTARSARTTLTHTRALQTVRSFQSSHGCAATSSGDVMIGTDGEALPDPSRHRSHASAYGDV
jgi:hypothetical protein